MKLLTTIVFGITLAQCVCAGNEEYAGWAAIQVEEALRQDKAIPWEKSRLVIPTADVAMDIHAAVTGAIYGRTKIEKQKPFQAVQSGEYWVVFGSLPKGHVGGTAISVIRASDGKVMRIIHGQ